MSNNIKQWKTTIVGGLLFTVGLIIVLIEYFTLEAFELNHYLLPLGFLTAGVMFLFAPDRFIDFLFKKADQKIK
jgi:hypothetical protein